MARNIERKEFPVLEMSCASCANHVEQTVRHLEGVGEASVNFASNTLSVAFDPGTITPVQIRDAVRAAGYDLIVDERNGEPDSVQFVLSTESIEVPDSGDTVTETPAEQGFFARLWDKLVALFT